ncbi:hypothetical protein E4U53_001991 [Claviceps sorghi]|nr:hypothetical protein E4U53_001991 [Claviceps sorghi]
MHLSSTVLAAIAIHAGHTLAICSDKFLSHNDASPAPCTYSDSAGWRCGTAHISRMAETFDVRAGDSDINFMIQCWETHGTTYYSCNAGSSGSFHLDCPSHNMQILYAN